MNLNYRQILIATITFISGAYFFLEFILPADIHGFKFGFYHEQISNGVVIVGTMAIGLGIINILRVHGEAILKSKKGWINSVALLFSLLITLYIQGKDLFFAEASLNSWKKFAAAEEFAIKNQNLDNPSAEKLPSEHLLAFLEREIRNYETGSGYLSLPPDATPDFTQIAESYHQALITSRQKVNSTRQLQLSSSQDKEAVTKHYQEKLVSLKATREAAEKLATYKYENLPLKQWSRFIENALFFPLGAAMFSLLGFYIANAAYRSFRIRSFEALVMMIAALVVVLGQIPHGPLYIWEGLPSVRLWLLENLSTPAFRAVYFGGAVAGLAMALRMWLSLERSPLSWNEKKR